MSILMRSVLQRHIGERGQADAFIVALLIFVLILIISGRRILVQ
jgi:hypothetical protein